MQVPPPQGNPERNVERCSSFLFSSWKGDKGKYKEICPECVGGLTADACFGVEIFCTKRWWSFSEKNICDTGDKYKLFFGDLCLKKGTTGTKVFFMCMPFHG